MGRRRVAKKGSTVPDDADGPSMKVALDTEYDSASLGDAFLHVSPFPRELDGGLDSFCARVHGKNHIVPKHLGDLLCETPKD